MEIREGKFKGVYELILRPASDERGFFMRTYDENLFAKFGIPTRWVQENHTKSKFKGTIRGLHFMLSPHTDGKLIRCIKGKLLDVFVDLRKHSDTLGQWDSTILSEDNFKWLYLPKGFAHGFCTLTDDTELLYKHDSFFHPESDSGIRYNDEDLNIKWPESTPLLSEKDKKLMTFKEFQINIEGL